MTPMIEAAEREADATDQINAVIRIIANQRQQRIAELERIAQARLRDLESAVNRRAAAREEAHRTGFLSAQIATRDIALTGCLVPPDGERH